MYFVIEGGEDGIYFRVFHTEAELKREFLQEMEDNESTELYKTPVNLEYFGVTSRGQWNVDLDQLGNHRIIIEGDVKDFVPHTIEVIKEWRLE